MAKQYYISPITKIEEVLDLITDPEKYIQYMKDLKDVHASIQNDLGLLRSKSDADRLVSEANDYLASAKETLDEADAEAKRLKAEAQQEYDKATKLVSDTEGRFNLWQKGLESKEKSNMAKERDLNDGFRELAAQKAQAEKDISERHAALAKQEEDVKVKLNKIEKAFTLIQ